MDKQLAELIARMKKIDADQAEIERQANLENDGAFSDEQRTQYANLKALFEELQKQKEQLEEDIAMKNARADRAEAMTPKVQARRTQPTAGTPAPSARNGLPIETENQDGEPTIRFKIPRNVRRSGALQNFRDTNGKPRDGLDAEHRAYRFGQWVLARVSQDLPGRYNFAYSKQFVENYMNPVNVAHGETDVTTGGHYLVPDEFSRDLIDLREQYGLVRRLFGSVAMTSDIKHEPRRSAGLTAYFVNESDAGTESNMTWDDVQLSAKDLMVLARMTNQLSADAVINIGDALAGEIAYAFSEKEDQCGFNGDGTSTYGGIQGVRNLLTSIDGAGTDSAGLKIQGTSNTWSAQVLADFHAVVGKLPVYADNGAVWVCHKTYFAEVMQKLELASGGVTAMEVSNGDRRPRPLFLGYPVEFSQVFPNATATTGVTAVLGNFALGALFGDRQQTSISFSEHATIGGQSVFERNQIAVRGTERFDVNVHGCGTASAVGPIVGLATGT